MLRLRTFMFERRLPRPRGAAREAADRAHAARALRPLRRAAAARAHRRRRRTEQRVVDWLAGMTDRFALRAFEELSLPRGFSAMALYTRDSIDRVKEAVDMVEVVGTQDRPAPRRHALDGALPVPRRAHAVVLGQRRATSSTTASAAASRRRDQVRRGDRGPRLPRVRRGAGRALQRASSSGRTTTREAEKRRQQRERLLKLLDRTATYYARVPVGARRRRRRRASTWPSAGWGRRCCASSAWATRRAPGTGSWWARSATATGRRS